MSFTHRLATFLERGLLFDSAIVAHGFASHLRDYDLIVETATTSGTASGGRLEGRYRFRFTHCPFAEVVTAVADDTWRLSWSDLFTDYGSWEKEGSPPGYVWGVNFADVYPGASLREKSARANEWSSRLGKPMYEVEIRTNCQNITLVFHCLTVVRTARGLANGDVEELDVEEPVYSSADA